MTDVMSRAARSSLMSRIRGKDTGPERTLRSMLHREGFRYRLHAAGIPGRPDLVFPTRRLVVFVDGCFWHACPRHFSMPATNRRFWERKIARNVARRSEVMTELRTAGWRVHTVWECRLREKPRLELRRIVRKLSPPGKDQVRAQSSMVGAFPSRPVSNDSPRLTRRVLGRGFGQAR